MDQRASALGLKPGCKSPDVAGTPSQTPGSLGHRDAALQDQPQCVILVQIALTHREQLVVHRPSLVSGRAFYHEATADKITEQLDPDIFILDVTVVPMHQGTLFSHITFLGRKPT